MQLQPFEVFNGITELIFIIITIILGLSIIAKYPKTKNREFLLVGIVWIGVAEPWFAGVFSFIYTLMTGKMVTVSLYLLIAFTFVPLTIFLWFIVFTDLVYKEKQKVILLIIAIYEIIFEVIFLFLVFSNPSSLAELHTPLVIEYKLVIQIYLVSTLLIILITGIIFSLKTRQAGTQEFKWRGNLLLIAFISIIIGSIFDTFFTRDVILILLKRLLLISASNEFYLAFAMPKWMKTHIFKIK